MMHGHLNLPGAGFDFDDDIDDYESNRYEAPQFDADDRLEAEEEAAQLAYAEEMEDTFYEEMKRRKARALAEPTVANQKRSAPPAPQPAHVLKKAAPPVNRAPVPVRVTKPVSPKAPAQESVSISPAVLFAIILVAVLALYFWTTLAG